MSASKQMVWSNALVQGLKTLDLGLTPPVIVHPAPKNEKEV